jgi:hypothetical protein
MSLVFRLNHFSFERLILETKKLQWSLWCVLFISATVYFALEGLGNLGVFAVVACYGVFGGLALGILLNTKSDEPYYVNINLFGLGASFAVAVGMVGIAVLFGLVINSSSASQSLVPVSFVQGVHGLVSASNVALGIVQVPSSYSTCLLSDVLFNFLIIAFVEEMLKFAAVSGLRDALGPLAEHERRNHKIVAYGVLIGFCFIEPLVMWVLWHGIESYANTWLLIPASVNGVLLLLLMFTKKVRKVKFGVIAAIIAHGAYDSYITVSAYLQGSVSSVKGMPFLPLNWTFADGYVLFLAVLAVVCLAIPIVLSRTE